MITTKHGEVTSISQRVEIMQEVQSDVLEEELEAAAEVVSSSITCPLAGEQLQGGGMPDDMEVDEEELEELLAGPPSARTQQLHNRLNALQMSQPQTQTQHPNLPVPVKPEKPQ